ncbi:MAG: transcriptional regulator, partial [Candidatus Coatesbacteria bacterium]
NKALSKMSEKQILADAELVVGGKVTYAALILLGTHKALGKFLSQAEVILEYRVNEASIPHDSRREFREGFFLFMDALWDEVNNRNDVQHFREGLFMRDIATFNEDVVREAILNAVSHRDYRLGGSVFLRQFPRRLQIESPGGFPTGITAENILWQQSPRNRRIAEAFARCGLVERSGQGLDKMFTESIREGKPRPDFSGTDDYRVVVTLRGEIQDARFLQFLERVGSERLSLFDTRDFLVLDLIHNEEKVPDHLKDRVHKLAEQKVVDVIGRGRGTRYILSRRFYKYIGKKGVYTRKKGLDRDTNKQLLLKHIRDNRKEGSRLKELMQVLPMLSRDQVRTLLRELEADGHIRHIGRTRASLWFPGPAETH